MYVCTYVRTYLSIHHLGDIIHVVLMLLLLADYVCVHVICNSCLCAQSHCRVIAMDLRGHGATVVKNESDLDMQTLAQDLKMVYIVQMAITH